MGAVREKPIVLTIDERETIRLIDKENLSQEEWGVDVGRTIAQKIHETARKKIADALVLGFALKIVAASFSFVAAVQTFAIKKTASNGKFKKNSKQKMDQILWESQ